MRYEYLDPEDMQNYVEHIQDAKNNRLVPDNAELEAVYQYFDFQNYACTVLFMRQITTTESGVKQETAYWLVATPDWNSHVFLNSAALYRYLNTIKDRLRYDMYGRVDRKWVLQTTASIDVGSFVDSTDKARKRFEVV